VRDRRDKPLPPAPPVAADVPRVSRQADEGASGAGVPTTPALFTSGFCPGFAAACNADIGYSNRPKYPSVSRREGGVMLAAREDSEASTLFL